MQRSVILLLEDDLVLRTGLAQQLAREGYDVRCATTGQEAVALVKTQTPDLVVLDLELPFNDPSDAWKDGFAVLGWLRHTVGEENLPVIINTIRVSNAVKARAKAGGVVAVFEKGESNQALLAIIRESLEGKQARANLAQ